MDAPIRDPKIINYTVSLLIQESDPTGHLSELYLFENDLDDLLLKAAEPPQEKSKSIFGRFFSKSKSPEILKLEKQLEEILFKFNSATVRLNSEHPPALSGRQITIVFEELQRVTEKAKLILQIIHSENSAKDILLTKFHQLKPAMVEAKNESKYEEGNEFNIPASIVNFNKAQAESDLLNAVYIQVINDVCLQLQVAIYSKDSHSFSTKELIGFRALLKETIHNSHTLNEYQKKELRILEEKINVDVNRLKKEKIELGTIEKFGDFVIASAQRTTQEIGGSRIFEIFKDDVTRTIRYLAQAHSKIEENEEDLFKPTDEEKSPSQVPDSKSI